MIELLALYDLAASPTSFDVVNFLARAEAERRRLGASGCRVLFVLTESGGYWDRENRGPAQHARRMDNMMLPLCALYGARPVRERAVTRGEAERILSAWDGPVFPRGYRLSAPVADCFQWAHLVAATLTGTPPPQWTAEPRAREALARRLPTTDKPLATITVREVQDGRRSDSVAWGRLAARLEAEGVRCVFLRDTDALGTPPPPGLDGAGFLDEASRQPALRAALYERADLNLMHSNGPMQLCWLGARTRSIVFGLHKPAIAHARAMPLRSMGLDIGAALPGHDGRHRLVWQPDDEATLIAHLPDMLAALFDRERPVETRAAQDPLTVAHRLRRAHRLPPARRIFAHLRAHGDTAARRRAGGAGLALCTAADAALPPLGRRLRFMREAAILIRADGADDADALAMRALVAHRAGLRERARAAAENAIAADGGIPALRASAHQLRALETLAGDGDPARVEADCAAALALDPHDPIAHLIAAESARRRGDQDAAATAHAAALACDPSVPDGDPADIPLPPL